MTGENYGLICEYCAMSFTNSYLVEARDVDPISCCSMCGKQAREFLKEENKMKTNAFVKPFPRLDPIQTKLREVYAEMEPIYSECCEAQGGKSIGGNPPRYCPNCGEACEFFTARYFDGPMDRAMESAHEQAETNL